MSKVKYQQVSKDRFEILFGRYQQFLENLDDPNAEPIKVFDALKQKQLDEIELIRQVSKDLQAKKEEDVKKAAAASKAAEEDAKKRAEEEKKNKEEAEEK